MEEDTEATQLMLEALFDIKIAVYDVKEFLMGEDDGSEEEEEEADS